jgi:hypothetical protein
VFLNMPGAMSVPLGPYVYGVRVVPGPSWDYGDKQCGPTRTGLVLVPSTAVLFEWAWYQFVLSHLFKSDPMGGWHPSRSAVVKFSAGTFFYKCNDFGAYDLALKTSDRKVRSQSGDASTFPNSMATTAKQEVVQNMDRAYKQQVEKIFNMFTKWLPKHMKAKAVDTLRRRFDKVEAWEKKHWDKHGKMARARSRVRMVLQYCLPKSKRDKRLMVKGRGYVRYAVLRR